MERLFKGLPNGKAFIFVDISLFCVMIEIEGVININRSMTIKWGGKER